MPRYSCIPLNGTKFHLHRNSIKVSCSATRNGPAWRALALGSEEAMGALSHLRNVEIGSSAATSYCAHPHADRAQGIFCRSRQVLWRTGLTQPVEARAAERAAARHRAEDTIAGGSAAGGGQRLPWSRYPATESEPRRHTGPRLQHMPTVHGDRAGAIYAPGLAILVVSLAFNALGESLRIVLDPTMKDR